MLFNKTSNIICCCLQRISSSSVIRPTFGPPELTLSGPLIGSGSGSSFIQAFSNIFVHFPLVPAWLCFKCCLKWSALKNFFAWLHSPNLCISCKCITRTSQSCSVAIAIWWPEDDGEETPDRGKSSPQYPQVSASLGRIGEIWNAAAYPDNAAQDHEWRRRWREFWWRSASFLFLKRLRQYAHSYCFSCSCALNDTLANEEESADWMEITWVLLANRISWAF